MFPLENLELTIDSIYKQLLQKIKNDGIIQDVSLYILANTQSYKRVFYVYNLLKTYKLIPLIIKEDKCEFSSIHYRNLGNIMYAKGDFYMAWQYYNFALMYSPLLAPTYSLAVANRSAVFAALKQYKACLEDIKMVFTLQYPESIRDKLLKRKLRCEEALQRAEDPDLNDEDQQIEDIFTFKANKHEKYIDASSKLSVESSTEMGRHVVAAEDIEVGEILVQEDPYVRVLLRSQITMACSHCFSRNYNLYPCPYCCMTMYCSRPCVEQAWEQYHSFECPVIASLIKSNFTKLEWLAFRTTIKARKDFADWESLLGALEEAEACTTPEDMGCKMTVNYDLVYSSQNYQAIHTLATNSEKRDVSDLFQKLVSAAVLMHYAAVASFIETDDPVLRRRIKKFTADTMMKHMMTAPTNMHGITANVENREGNFVEEYNIGSAAYAFLSLINHSCSPNVVRYTRLGTAQVTLIAIRPIVKGMHILDNYGFIETPREDEDMEVEEIERIKPSDRCVHCSMTPRGTLPKKAHYAVHTLAERQSILNTQYKFSCCCEACEGQWQLYQVLKSIVNPPASIVSKLSECLNQDVIEALQKADKKRALQMYKPLCELLTALEPYHPSKEAAECQEAMKQCLAIFAGSLQYDFSRFVDWEIPCPKIPGIQPESSRFYIGAGAFNLLDDTENL